MMEFTYKRADELDFDPRLQMGMIFAEGFYQWLQYFSKDKEKLARGAAHFFDLSQFFVALHGDEIAAIVACTDGRKPITLDRRILCKELGFFRGRLAYTMLKKNVIENAYPFPLNGDMGSIEFVVSSTKYRRMGSTHGLLTYVMETMPYKDYVLEVVDTNTGAIALYEKLGFTEIQRIAEKHEKRSGFAYKIYMKRCGGEGGA